MKKLGMFVSRCVCVVKAVLANLRDAEKVVKLEAMVTAQKAQVVGLADEFSKLAAERNIWKGRAGDYRMMVLGCLSKTKDGYVRFQKEFMDPSIDYKISIKEDETSVRLKTVEKRNTKYVKTADEAKKESKLRVVK